MFKTKIQIFSVLYFSITLLIITACKPSEQNKKDIIQKTNSFLEEGNPKAAIKLIETNFESFDKDIPILELLAKSHLQLEDPLTASVILLNAYELDPKNSEILDLYLKTLKEANLNTDEILLDVAEFSPKSLDQLEWQRVSKLSAEEGKINDALDAYFKYLGSNKISETTSPKDALLVGGFYLSLQENKLAKPWLSLASGSDSIEALPAQLKLLSIELQMNDWSALHNRIEIIERRFPNALKASPYSELPEIVEKKLEKNNGSLPKENSNIITSSKTGFLGEIEDLEIFANTPAEIPVVENTLGMNNNSEIIIKPIDPYLNIEELEDRSEISDFELKSINEQKNLSLVEINELIIKADRLILTNDFAAAAELYREVLESSPDRHDIWDRIAQIYYANKEYTSAESSALKAISYQPNNISYTINYLNIAKETKSEIRFLPELVSASKQFPNSPEITLSLARAYDRSVRYQFKAREFYTKFITLAPNHPQRSEAEAAILRLP